MNMNLPGLVLAPPVRTVTGTGPGSWLLVSAERRVLFTTVVGNGVGPRKIWVAPATKSDPSAVSNVPPMVGPALGLKAVTMGRGARSTITTAVPMLPRSSVAWARTETQSSRDIGVGAGKRNEQPAREGLTGGARDSVIRGEDKPTRDTLHPSRPRCPAPSSAMNDTLTSVSAPASVSGWGVLMETVGAS